MRAVVPGVLSLFWAVVGYVGLLRVGKRFFTGRYRAETAAAAIVIAFTVGMNWPRSDRGDVAPPALPPSAAAVPVAAPAAALSKPGTVGAACSSAHLTTATGKGSVDVALVQSGTIAVAATPGEQLLDGDVVVERGWAANSQLNGLAAAVCVAVDGAILSGVEVTYGASRPDVANAFHNPALLATGYEIRLPAQRVEPGSHHVGVVAVTADGTAATLPGGVVLSGPRAKAKS